MQYAAGGGLPVLHDDLHAARLPIRASDGLPDRLHQRARHDPPPGDDDRSMHGLHDDLHAALHGLPPTGPLCAVYDLFARVPERDHHPADGLPDGRTDGRLVRSAADGMCRLHADERRDAGQPVFASLIGRPRNAFARGDDAWADRHKWRPARAVLNGQATSGASWPRTATTWQPPVTPPQNDSRSATVNETPPMRPLAAPPGNPTSRSDGRLRPAPRLAVLGRPVARARRR